MQAFLIAQDMKLNVQDQRIAQLMQQVNLIHHSADETRTVVINMEHMLREALARIPAPRAPFPALGR
jgi:hypothetical protein